LKYIAGVLGSSQRKKQEEKAETKGYAEVHGEGRKRSFGYAARHAKRRRAREGRAATLRMTEFLATLEAE
jgi:hypothetical protein